MADGESQRRRRRRPSSECEAPEKKREKAVGGGQERCGREFFDRPCEELAVALLGCELVCRGESGEECRGEVVETEAYLGGEDKAAHSYKGRRTAANEAMFMPPGTAYVYTIYGVHHCFNISSRGPGAAVLVRALQPTGGQRVMQVRRGGRGERELCRGPGKLCQALAITKQHNRVDLVTSADLWLERGSAVPADLILKSARVGVASAGAEWGGALLRFFQSDCVYVSKPHS